MPSYVPPGVDPNLLEQQRRLNRRKDLQKLAIAAAAAAVLVIVASFVALFGAIAGDDTTDDDRDAAAPPATSSTSTPDLPDCDTAWQTGATLPAPYEGCISDGDVVEPTFLDCTEGNGRYVQWDDGAAYAREGAVVIDRAGQLAQICNPGLEQGGYEILASDEWEANIDANSDELLATMQVIAPHLDEGDFTDVVNTCSNLAGGSAREQVAQNGVTRFSGGIDEQVTLEQATQLVDLSIQYACPDLG